MQRLTRDHRLLHAFDASRPNALRVCLGEAFVVETEDASGGTLTDGTRLPTPTEAPFLRHSPPMANPVSGPVFVEGVRPHTTICVDILDVVLAPTGVTYGRPSTSPMADSVRWRGLSEPFVAVTSHDGGDVAVVGSKLRWRQAPMIGTLACAPEWEVRSSWSGQGSWGGNLDVTDSGIGSSVFLSAHHDGGMLFVGDVHGCQGEGEYAGVADECRAEVTLRVRHANEEVLSAPRLVTPDRIIALGLGRPLEHAVEQAIRHLMEWLRQSFDFTDTEAYRIVSLHPDFRIHVYQMTAINALSFVAGASIPLAFVDPTRSICT
jgi:amidase